MLTTIEVTLIGLHGAIILICLVLALTRSKIEIWAPYNIYAVISLVYGLIGPLFQFYVQNTYFLGMDLREEFASAAAAYLLSTVAFMIGYCLPVRTARQPPPIYKTAELRDFCIGVFLVVGVAMLVISNGNVAMFLPVSRSGSDLDVDLFSGNALITYVFNLVHLGIPGLALAFLAVRAEPSVFRWIAFGACAVALVSIFISFGFRFRVVWILMTVFSSYCLVNNWKPRLVPSLVVGFFIIQVLGVIGSTRTYYGGLALDRVGEKNTVDRLSDGLGETAIFYTTGAVVSSIPSRYPHTYLDPLWIAVTFPIPRKIWKEKPNSQTIIRMVQALGGSEEAFQSGPAVPYFGEWYIAFGWFGLVGSGFVFGYLMKRVWRWMLVQRNDPLRVVIYSTLVGFMQYTYSRGYFAQVVMFLVFSVLPFFLYFWWRQRKLRFVGRL